MSWTSRRDDSQTNSFPSISVPLPTPNFLTAVDTNREARVLAPGMIRFEIIKLKRKFQFLEIEDIVAVDSIYIGAFEEKEITIEF